VLVASSRVDVAHYFIDADQTDAEIGRVRAGAMRSGGRDPPPAAKPCRTMGPKDGAARAGRAAGRASDAAAGRELISGVKHWMTDRLYNAEWALTTQLEVIARQFDEMEDEYLRERKADLEQVVERILRHMKGVVSPVVPAHQRPVVKPRSRTCCWTTTAWTCRWCWWRTTCRQPT
jgi:phosphotransferase system enzyme I (PtsI)